MSIVTKLIIALCICGLIGAGVYFGLDHYEGLVAKANQVDQLKSDLEAANEKQRKTQQLFDKADGLLKEERKYTRTLEAENARFKSEKGTARKDSSVAVYLDTPIPPAILELLCKYVGAYKGQADCPRTPEPVDGKSKSSAVRKENH